MRQGGVGIPTPSGTRPKRPIKKRSGKWSQDWEGRSVGDSTCVACELLQWGVLGCWQISRNRAGFCSRTPRGRSHARGVPVRTATQGRGGRGSTLGCRKKHAISSASACIPASACTQVNKKTTGKSTATARPTILQPPAVQIVTRESQPFSATRRLDNNAL